MTENASNSFSRKNKKKMLVFPKNAEKNASTIEKGLPVRKGKEKQFFFVYGSREETLDLRFGLNSDV